jgi:ubiquinone/menaquinone biosynthesis C-methylase UbiE
MAHVSIASMPDRVTDALREQYKDGSNLMARVRLHARFSTNRYGLFRWIFDQISLAPDARVMELGTGTALLWTENANRIPAGWRVTLSDFSHGMIAEARTRLAAVQHKFVFMQIDAQMLPFEDGSFDAVFANHMLYHVRDIPRALGEIRRVLAPGGRCFAATLGSGNLREFDQMVHRFVGIPMSFEARRFGLENGLELMRAAFSQAECRRYEDSLEITEAQPLIDYFNSTRRRERATAEQMAALRGYIESEIARRGSIRMTKDPGLLVASV